MEEWDYIHVFDLEGFHVFNLLLTSQIVFKINQNRTSAITLLIRSTGMSTVGFLFWLSRLIRIEPNYVIINIIIIITAIIVLTTTVIIYDLWGEMKPKPRAQLDKLTTAVNLA